MKMSASPHFPGSSKEFLCRSDKGIPFNETAKKTENAVCWNSSANEVANFRECCRVLRSGNFF